MVIAKIAAVWRNEHPPMPYVVCNLCYSLVHEGNWKHHQRYHRRQGHRW